MPIKNDHAKNNWLRDVDARQQNVTFPETVENEARLWRNLVRGKLRAVQVVGLVLVAATLVGVVVVAVMRQLRVYEGEDVWSVFGGQLLAVGIVALFAVAIGIAARPRKRK